LGLAACGFGFAARLAGFALAPSRFALRRSGRERGSDDSTSLPSDPFDMRA
jgi:hypothetical protein